MNYDISVKTVSREDMDMKLLAVKFFHKKANLSFAFSFGTRGSITVKTFRPDEHYEDGDAPLIWQHSAQSERMYDGFELAKSKLIDRRVTRVLLGEKSKPENFDEHAEIKFDTEGYMTNDAKSALGGMLMEVERFYGRHGTKFNLSKIKEELMPCLEFYVEACDQMIEAEKSMMEGLPKEKHVPATQNFAFGDW